MGNASTDQVFPDTVEAALEILPGQAAEDEGELCPAKKEPTVQQGQSAALQHKERWRWVSQGTRGCHVERLRPCYGVSYWDALP